MWDLRYSPMEADLLYVFHRSRYLCAARPVEYSSMKNAELAERKVVEKRERRKRIADTFRSLTQSIPDFRNYSEVSPLEKTAALIGAEKKRIAEERREAAREYTQEELDRKVAQIETLQGSAGTHGETSSCPSGHIFERICPVTNGASNI